MFSHFGISTDVSEETMDETIQRNVFIYLLIKLN